ncbi:MAG: diacylglycerol kinase family protein [Pseudomonadota bacterium]
MTVLINKEGGAANAAGDKLSGQVEAAFAKAGGNADVHMLAAGEMESAIKRAAKAKKRFAVAGGDGTIAAAAQILTGTKTELAILPLGTLNHFARDLGIPVKLEEAAKLAVHGKAAAIDVGDVNGTRFINNVSLGMYPFMVHRRDDVRERRGWPKWLATVPASWDAIARLRHHRLRLDLGEGTQPVTTALLFVGNNRYSLEPGSVGSRKSLTDGELAVYAVKRSSRIALLWFGMRALVGMVERAKDFAAIGACDAFTITSPESRIEIALDGEVRRIDLPAKFTTHPGGLMVVVPA